jgi:hypothetical protein
MTADNAGTLFVDQLLSTIQILRGMINRSRAAVAQSSMEPIATALRRDVVSVIDLTMLDKADNLVDPPAPAEPSRFCLQDLQLPPGATAEGETVKIPNNHGNVLATATDGARRHCRERKIVASLDKFLSRKRSQPMQTWQRLHAGFASSHPTMLPDSQALLTGMARHTFMLELQSVTKDIDLSKKRPLLERKGKEKWFSPTKCNMEMVLLGSSPCASAIESWVV